MRGTSVAGPRSPERQVPADGSWAHPHHPTPSCAPKRRAADWDMYGCTDKAERGTDPDSVTFSPGPVPLISGGLASHADRGQSRPPMDDDKCSPSAGGQDGAASRFRGREGRAQVGRRRRCWFTVRRAGKRRKKKRADLIPTRRPPPNTPPPECRDRSLPAYLARAPGVLRAPISRQPSQPTSTGARECMCHVSARRYFVLCSA